MLKLRYHSSRLFNMLTVVILSLLCVLLNYLTRIDFHPLELPKGKPEFAATGIAASIYSKNGQLLYRAVAESGLQYPENSRIYLQQLNLEAFSESSGLRQEHLISNDGWMDTIHSQAFLGESVILTLANPDAKAIIYIYTKHVNLDANKQVAASSAPLKATRGKSVMTGVGFYLDYPKQLLTIESKVRIIYYTQQ